MAKSAIAKKNKSSDTPKQKSFTTTQKIKSEGTDPALLELFTDGIKDIYWAENHLVKGLPKMIKAAGAKSLVAALTDHLKVTKTHVGRLERVFEILGKDKRAKKCDAMEGLSKEGEAVIEDTEEGTATRDVGIIMASQKVEHYEIASYGSLAQLAKTLGLNDIAALLSQTLEEEKEAEQLLSSIAKNNINYQAAGE
ncbi:MAG: ferritin-like domain-containing protein [Ferruginibacter sp.]